MMICRPQKINKQIGPEGHEIIPKVINGNDCFNVVNATILPLGIETQGMQLPRQVVKEIDF